MALPFRPFAENGNAELSLTQGDDAFQYLGDRLNVVELADTWKGAVLCVAPGNINLATPGATIDGVTMTMGCRVLLPAQTIGSEQGCYLWYDATTLLTRSLDSNTAVKLWGAKYSVLAGTSAGKIFDNTNATLPILGVDTLTFAPEAFQQADTQLTDIAGLVYTGNALKVIRVKATEDGMELAPETSGSGAPYVEVTLGAPSSVITFLDIPQTGRNLRITLVGQDDSGVSVPLYIYFNADQEPGHYAGCYFGSAGNGNASGTANGAFIGYFTTGNYKGVIDLDVYNYSGSVERMLRGTWADKAPSIGMVSANWTGITPILSLTITTGTTFAIGTVASLYLE
jgi:hypothetical protein